MTENNHPTRFQLQAFHDGELEQPLIAELSAHCESCQICRAELAGLNQVEQLLTATETPELPGSIWQRVRPQKDHEKGLKPVFAYAACVAGIILGVLLGPIQSDAEEADKDSMWAAPTSVWDKRATSSLLAVYQSGQE